jgi:hypothetical protein
MRVGDLAARRGAIERHAGGGSFCEARLTLGERVDLPLLLLAGAEDPRRCATGRPTPPRRCNALTKGGIRSLRSLLPPYFPSNSGVSFAAIAR